MSTQTELIPKTAADEAREVLIHLEVEVEKRDKALAKARENYHEAVDWAAKQRELVQRLESEERTTVTVETVVAEASEPAAEPADQDGVEEGEFLELDGVAVTEDGVEYETKTGEVVERPAEIEAPSSEVQESATEDAELPDSGSVYVLWPDMDDPVLSDVGPYTRYGELIADGLQEGEDAASFVVAGPVLDDGQEPTPCDVAALIPRSEWGMVFRVSEVTA